MRSLKSHVAWFTAIFARFFGASILFDVIAASSRRSDSGKRCEDWNRATARRTASEIRRENGRAAGACFPGSVRVFPHYLNACDRPKRLKCHINLANCFCLFFPVFFFSRGVTCARAARSRKTQNCWPWLAGL